jgi:fatty acid desaturase
MSSPARRPSSSPRRKREQRAYLATMAGGAAGLVTVVGALLAIVGAIGWTLPILALIVAVISWVVFRGAVRR